jgi:hypothetical protein
MSPKSKAIELPHGDYITLSEAVTAFVHGRAWDEMQRLVLRAAMHTLRLPIDQSAKLDFLLERLNSAARDGHIKFRALKNGDSSIEHQNIDPLYFKKQRRFDWTHDSIWSDDPTNSDDTLEDSIIDAMTESNEGTADWEDVHLEREAFVLWLRDMGGSVKECLVADVPGNQKLYKTGLPGRPTSIQLILQMARKRLDAEDYPETFTKFAEELAEAFAAAEPDAPRATVKTLTNSADLRGLWRHRKQDKKIEAS